MALTKKEMMRELKQCGKDPFYFLNNYAKIEHAEKGLIPFKTFDYQEQLLKDFHDHRYNIILKARQLGITTISAGYIAWMMFFQRNKYVLVMATKFDVATTLVQKVKAIINHLPPFFKQLTNVDLNNRTFFSLKNGSKIQASSTSSDAGRSKSASLLVIDEAAHIEKFEDLWTGLQQTLATGGRCIALSTPNGVGNWFHKTWVSAESGNSNFKPTELMWDVHPDRDLEWFRQNTKDLTKRQIAQELQCNFNASGDTVFTPEDIGAIFNSTKEPEYKTQFDRNYWIWETFNKDFTYMISADVARGDGADYSVFHVLKLETMEIIAEYQGKVAPDIFAEILYSAGSEYGNCMIVVENNTIGFSTLEKLKEKKYPNIYHSIKSTHEYIEEYLAENRGGAVAGFTTSSKTRPLIIAKLEQFIRNRVITIYSSRLANEMKTFIWHNGKATAQRGYHDDLIMALAIGCWVRDTAIIENRRDVEYTKAALTAITTYNSTLNTSIDGMPEHRSINNSGKINQQRELLWLYKG